MPDVPQGGCAQSALKWNFLVGVRKTVEIMRGAKIRLDVAPQILLQTFDITVAAVLQGRVDQFARRHLEAGMHGVRGGGRGLAALRGWSGTRQADRSTWRRPKYAGDRRRNRDRRAP